MTQTQPTTVGTERSEQVELERLYADLAAADMAPLWTQRDDLLPIAPQPKGVPAMWRWSTLYPLAARCGDLVPVGRGGERRAIALANPGIPGQPYSTATLWTAIQFLGPHETAPAHRHVQTAFRFVVEGAGVWTNVDGDAVSMNRGDLLLTPGWHFHEHHNTTDEPMAWIDGLDIPLVDQLDAGFFEFGPDRLATTRTPTRSVGERLWGHPGLRPLVEPATTTSPLMAYRWQHTDDALSEQLSLEADGVRATIESGHAAVRFTNPLDGGDALRTIRTEMHRIRGGTSTAAVRTVGSAVWQVFSGTADVRVGDRSWELGTGDLFAVPSWAPVTITARDGDLDLFRFGDEPVYQALGLYRRSLVSDEVANSGPVRTSGEAN